VIITKASGEYDLRKEVVGDNTNNGGASDSDEKASTAYPSAAEVLSLSFEMT